MIPNLNNSGSMPINGGAARSGNGETMFSTKAKFGGLNYGTGVNPYVLIGLAVLAVGAFVYVQTNIK